MSAVHSPSRLSVSALRDYARCPFYYKLARVDKVPEDNTKHQLWAGSLLHAAFMLAYGVPTQPEVGRTIWTVDNEGTLADCMELFEYLWYGTMPEPPDGVPYSRAQDAYLELRKDSHMKPPLASHFTMGPTKALKDRNNNARQEAWKVYYRDMLQSSLERGLAYDVIALEHEVNYQFGEVNMLGYIDVVMRRRDGRLVYLDLKSGQRCPSDAELAFDDQMNSYYTAEYEGELPSEVWYAHMKTGSILATPRNEPLIDALHETVPLVMADIQAGNFKKRLTTDCGKCSRRKSCMGV